MSISSFPGLRPEFLGLYPIVEHALQLEQLLPLGIKMIQLRIKNASDFVLREQIQRGVQLARHYSVDLFINDYWKLAIQFGAYGVHLGQEDLDAAGISELKASGLRLGVSAYSDTELLIARRLKPSYIAYGPVFPTQSKQMSVPACGTEKLDEVRRQVHCPLIAIGGIGLGQLPEVLACQVDGVAVISAIRQAIDPVQATLKLMTVIEQKHVGATQEHEASG